MEWIMINRTKLGYSIAEACAAIPCGRSKLYELIAAGVLDARKVGVKVVIAAESLEKYHGGLPRAAVKIPAAVRRGTDRTPKACAGPTVSQD
jgi:excisionase family DNA binding protein